MGSPILIDEKSLVQEDKSPKKKGLFSLLLAFCGGSKRNLYLVLFFALLAALSLGGAAVTGHLSSLTGSEARSGFSGGEDASDVVAGGLALTRATLLPGAPTPEQQRLNAVARMVSGKARDGRNDAVNYVSRDPSEIGNAQAQANLDKAPAGHDVDGVPVDGGPLGGGSLAQDAAAGALGPGGAGSVGMTGAGSGLFSGAGFSTQSGKAALGSAMASQVPPVGAPFTRNGVAVGRSSAMRYSALSTRITHGVSGAANFSQGNLHPVMYQLMRAGAYTMASASCNHCASESVLINNRGWATGETDMGQAEGGAGLLDLPGDTSVQVSQDSVNQLMSGQGGVGGLVAAASESQQCMSAESQYNNTDGNLVNEMSTAQWNGKSLANKPSCCNSGDVNTYNNAVNQWQSQCTQYNSNNAQVNTACGMAPSTGSQSCTTYQTMSTCGFFSCLGAIIAAIVIIIAAVILTIASDGAAAPIWLAVAGMSADTVGTILVVAAVTAMVVAAVAIGINGIENMSGSGGGGGGAPAAASSGGSPGGMGGGSNDAGAGGNQQQGQGQGDVGTTGLIGSGIGGSNTGTGGMGQTNSNLGNSVNVGNQNTNTNGKH